MRLESLRRLCLDEAQQLRAAKDMPRWPLVRAQDRDASPGQALRMVTTSAPWYRVA